MLALKVPPPLVMLTGAALMWLLARVDGGGRPEFWVGVTALLTVLAGIGIALAGVVSFRAARTTISPLTPDRSSSLVISGVYRYSRNPMYLGMALVLLAWSLWLGSWLSLVVVPLFILYINHFQIRPEEEVLTSRFGRPYRDYCARVRRWL